MTTYEVEEQEETRSPAPPGPRSPRITWQKLTLLPTALVVLLLTTLLWFRQARLDTFSQNALSQGRVEKALWQHIEMTTLATFLVMVIAIPLAIALTHGAAGRFTATATAIATAGRRAPAIGLLALLVLWLGTGHRAVLVAIVAYAVLPVLSHTIAGLKENDSPLLEVARGIGMSPMDVLARVELPMALPLLLACARIALVLNVGTATLAAFGGGGGLGVLITAGISHHSLPLLLLGSVLTTSLALLIDWGISMAELLTAMTLDGGLRGL
ncbi:ABC transporter permease subunit [Streptomyces sp. CA-106110]|uniref:ABC transporter permease subunit n=1 Tax=Streptomyces sp. CA-106110 TaxID=3240044 RepID=UPI003D8F8003